MCNIFSSAATIMWFVNQAASDVRNCDTQKTLIYILIFIYYINTSEIPSELLYENFISSQVKITLSSHVKRSPWLWLHNNLHLFHSGVYIINRMLHARSWIWILSSCVQLDISLFFAEHSALSYLLSLTRVLFTFNVAHTLSLNLHRIAMMLVAWCIKAWLN